MARDDDRKTNVLPDGAREAGRSYNPSQDDLPRLIEILAGADENDADRVAAAGAIEQLLGAAPLEHVEGLTSTLAAIQAERPPHATFAAVQRLLNRVRTWERTGHDVARDYTRPLTERELDTLAQRLSDSLARRFTIGREISVGGMGRVYEARRNSDGRAAVAKYLLQAYAGRPDLEARFRREADVLERLDHPNVVTILEHGGREGDLYLILEYVAGGSLDQQVGSAELDVPRCGRILGDICDGLQAVHDAGIVHRDLKPANVLLTEDGRAKLTDFGLALVQEEAGPRLTRPFDEFGTGPYMAPEQKRSSGDVDHLADLWSLGVMTYELFSGGRFPEVDYRPLAGMGRGVPAGVDALVRRSLKLDRQERWPEAAAFREALDGALEVR